MVWSRFIFRCQLLLSHDSHVKIIPFPPPSRPHHRQCSLPAHCSSSASTDWRGDTVQSPGDYYMTVIRIRHVIIMWLPHAVLYGQDTLFVRRAHTNSPLWTDYWVSVRIIWTQIMIFFSIFCSILHYGYIQQNLSMITLTFCNFVTGAVQYIDGKCTTIIWQIMITCTTAIKKNKTKSHLIGKKTFSKNIFSSVVHG